MLGGTSSDAGDANGDGPQNGLAGFAFRKQITVIRPAAGPGTLFEFPLSIDIHDDADLRANADSNRSFAFTTADGMRLADEIVSFNKTSGDLEAWVKVPSLFDGITVLYLYYGGDTGHDPLTTWTAAAGVWHMNNVGTGEMDVSGHQMTVSAPDAAKSPETAAGFVGSARLYDGQDDRLCSTNTFTFGLSSFSFSVWVEAVQSGLQDSPISHRAQDTSGFEVSLGQAWNLNVSSNNGQSVNVDIGSSDPAWLHIGVVLQRTAGTAGTVTVFRNGNVENGAGFSNFDDLPVGNDFCLGDETHRYKGKIDEARVYLTAVPQAWFVVEHANVRDRGTFMTFGPEEITQ